MGASRATSRRRQAGFTLIEIITVVSIIAILTAIAYPSYMSYSYRAKRSDATNTMTFLAQQLERCYSQNFTYAGCAQVPVGVTNSNGTWYNVTLALTNGGAGYTMVAIPNGLPQAHDTDCASFTMTSGGGQSALNSGGADNTATCWGSK